MSDVYNKVRINGSLPGGERWSINPTFMGDFSPVVEDYVDLLSWATAIAGLNSGNVFGSGLRQILSPAGSVTSVRCEYYDTNNSLAQVAEYVLPSAVAGTGTATKPFQTALVLSLRTGRPGRSYRGRLFFPALGAAVSVTTLRFSSPSTATIATEVAAWLNAVAGAATGGAVLTPCVFSPTIGQTSQITSVEVGDILDVQRRRRDRLVEAIASAAV